MKLAQNYLPKCQAAAAQPARAIRWAFFIGCCVMMSTFRATATETRVAEPVISLRILETKTGVRFGLWGKPLSRPAPTLIILASTVEATLEDAYFRQAGTVLAEQGYLCVSIDLPAHGPQQKSGEPTGLDGWRYRVDHGEDFVGENNRRLAQVLDHLIAAGYTDAARIAICGTSRGGFLALHFAAFDPRVVGVAAFAPVTDLRVLREFQGSGINPLLSALGLTEQAAQLAGRAVWVSIGDRDTRVGTDEAIALVRRVSAAAQAQGLNARAELHVLPEPRGHTTPTGAPEQAAQWINRQLKVTASDVQGVRK